MALLTLRWENRRIVSTADGSPLPILQHLGPGVSASSSIPAALKLRQQQQQPWAVEAANKGVFLDLCAPTASYDAVVDLGEVS